MNILALDIGISSVKAAVLGSGAAAGRIAQASFGVERPTPEAAELDWRVLWQAVAAAARAAVLASGVSGRADDVGAIAFACFPAGLVLLGRDDKPRWPIWMPSDRRARPAARQIWTVHGDEFLRATGSRPLPGAVSVTCLRHMLAQDPYVLHHVRTYLHVAGWLGFHMTGERAFDFESASASGLFGTLTDRQWSSTWCQRFEVDPAWLPLVLRGGAVLGSLRAEIAADLAVPAGIPVKVGLGSLSSAMLAAGMQPGDLWHELADTQVLATLKDKPTPAPRLFTRLHSDGTRHFQVAHNPLSAGAFDWLHGLCFQDQTRAEFLASLPQALERATRVTLDPPYLAGDPLGIEAGRGALRDLELTTDRHELLTALVQAVVREHREMVAALGVGSVVFRSGAEGEAICRILPGYPPYVQTIENASLRGVLGL